MKVSRFPSESPESVFLAMEAPTSPKSCHAMCRPSGGRSLHSWLGGQAGSHKSGPSVGPGEKLEAPHSDEAGWDDEEEIQSGSEMSRPGVKVSLFPRNLVILGVI